MYMPWSKGSAAAIFGALLPDLSCLIFESFSGFFVRTGSLLHLSLSFRVAKSVDRVTIHSLRTLSTWLRFLSDSKIQRSCENEKKTGNYSRNFRLFRINIAKNCRARCVRCIARHFRFCGQEIVPPIFAFHSITDAFFSMGLTL